MKRYDIINEIADSYGLKNYLEIGLRNPECCFNLIKCDTKMSVDPGLESEINLATYRYYSDDFFKKLDGNELDLPSDYKWDIIFIDGLHLASQCYRDFTNSLRHLAKNGFIVLHDSNPPTIYYAREDYTDYSTTARYDWCGTVWKAIQKIRTTHELDIITVDTDMGCCVIRNNKNNESLDVNINEFYDYNTFSQHRSEILNLKSVKDFKLWLTKTIK